MRLELCLPIRPTVTPVIVLPICYRLGCSFFLVLPVLWEDSLLMPVIHTDRQDDAIWQSLAFLEPLVQYLLLPGLPFCLYLPYIQYCTQLHPHLPLLAKDL